MSGFCLICRDRLGEEEGISIEADNRSIRAHSGCIVEFKALIRHCMASTDMSATPPFAHAFVKEMEGVPVLVRRDWSNYSVPILAYLDHSNDAREPSEVYAWLNSNEVRVSNPSQYVSELIKRGLVSAIRKDGHRFIFITDAGRRYLREQEKEPPE